LKLQEHQNWESENNGGKIVGDAMTSGGRRDGKMASKAASKGIFQEAWIKNGRAR
jgi:hypothetical protein